MCLAIIEFGFRMKNSADLGGCYSQRLKNVFFVYLLTKNNTTLSPGFFGQRVNNLRWAALLTSLAQYDKIYSKFCQQQLVMVNYVCGFNQSEKGKYFE